MRDEIVIEVEFAKIRSCRNGKVNGRYMILAQGQSLYLKTPS